MLAWGTFTDLVLAHMADAAQRNLWGVGGSYYQFSGCLSGVMGPQVTAFIVSF